MVGTVDYLLIFILPLVVSHTSNLSKPTNLSRYEIRIILHKKENTKIPLNEILHLHIRQKTNVNKNKKLFIACPLLENLGGG